MAKTQRAWLARLGARDPDQVLASEADEAAIARFLLLRALRHHLTAAGEPFPLGAALKAGEDAWERLHAAGADPDDLQAVVRTVAAEAALAQLDLLEAGRDWEAPSEAPGWALIETDAAGRPTGRPLGGLQETLFELLDIDHIGSE